MTGTVFYAKDNPLLEEVFVLRQTAREGWRYADELEIERKRLTARVEELEEKPSDWGRDDLMVLAAFRYCIKSNSYIVGDCMEWLMRIWPELDRIMQRKIVGEIETEIAFGRLDALGLQDEWEKVRALWGKE